MNETKLRRLLSGQATGVGPACLRSLLGVSSLVYSLAMRIRNGLFNLGWKSIHRTAVPVISLGNLTTGGTGKTPLVALVCRLLQESGLHPGIVSRGYGSVDGQPNDEKLVLNLLCPSVPHPQNPDRVAAAHSLTAAGGVDVIVMDDGFQHRRLHRDLDIVLIDATNPFGFGHLLPRGLLREPLSALKRADVVIVTRCDLASEQDLAEIERRIIAAAPQLADRILHVEFQPTSLRSLDGNTLPLSDFAGQSVHLMAGIGNPDAFETTAIRARMKVTGTSWFPDHHQYTNIDLQQVQQRASSSGTECIVTTLKDLVKLPTECRDIRAMEIAAVFPNPQHADVLRELIWRAVGPQSSGTSFRKQ
ncbi:MAG: tetraacyldisaccharide 4'-kinase [Planctomycetaceae bacterium]|nr:tetraacyldisaccharide 4'-kinase [Planctomycetaceae bacterium]